MYDIIDSEELKFFKKGDKILPELEEIIGQSRKFLDTALAEEELTDLKKRSVREKYEWLVENNKCILLRDKDWRKIYTNIGLNKDNFGRYYSIMRVKMTNQSQVDLCVGLMINDELYAYSKILAEQ